MAEVVVMGQVACSDQAENPRRYGGHGEAMERDVETKWQLRSLVATATAHAYIMFVPRKEADGARRNTRVDCGGLCERLPTNRATPRACRAPREDNSALALVHNVRLTLCPRAPPANRRALPKSTDRDACQT